MISKYQLEEESQCNFKCVFNLLFSEKYGIIMTLIWQSLEGEGKTWKNLFKVICYILVTILPLLMNAYLFQTLTLIEFLIKNGSERVIEATRDKLFRIRSLQDYNFYEGNIDKGSGVREKSKQIVELLGNNEAIRSEREKSRALKNKFVGISNDGSGSNFGGSSYSGGGIGGRDGRDTYKDSNSYSGSNSASTNNSGRYSDSASFNSSSSSAVGGGAYNSNRPTRYEDDHTSNTGISNSKDGFEDSIDEDEFKFKSSSISKPKSSTTSSEKPKLKVSIKKSVAATASFISPSHTNSNDIDLFNDSGPTSNPLNSGNTDFFDPFSTGPVSNPTQASASTTFDPFAPTVPPPQPSQQQQMFHQPVQQQQVFQQPIQQEFQQPVQQQAFQQPVQQQTIFDPFASAPPAVPSFQPVQVAPAVPSPYVQSFPNNNFAPAAPIQQVDIFNSFQSNPAPPVSVNPFPPSVPLSNQPILNAANTGKVSLLILY